MTPFGDGQNDFGRVTFNVVSSSGQLAITELKMFSTQIAPQSQLCCAKEVGKEKESGKAAGKENISKQAIEDSAVALGLEGT